MHIGLNNQRYNYTMRLYNDEIVNVTKCDNEKDLGVIFYNKLIFDLHIQAASNKENQSIGIVRRTFSYLNRYCFIKLYKAMVRPHLEYGNTIWYLYLKRQSKSIERVQRRATRLVFKPNTLNYSERMIFLRLPSLKFRRIRGDLIQVYKIMNGMDNLDWHDFFEKAAVNITRRSNNKLFVKFSRTNKRKNAFSCTNLECTS